jgi:hypothetical protein
MRAHTTVHTTTRVYPSFCGKNLKIARVNPPELCLLQDVCSLEREREHEDIDLLVDEDPDALAALLQCGLLKFFHCPFMWAQPRLLNALVDYWHPDAEAFMLEGQSLTPTTEDIYFLTGLSRRGEPVNFCTFPSGPHNISELIELHCEADTDKMGTQVCR